MNVGERDQRRHVDADQRAIEQQVLEAGRTVIGDHHVGGGQIGADIGLRARAPPVRRQVRRSAAGQSMPPEYCAPQIARTIVQLDDHVHRQLPQPLQQRDAEQVERRGGRPGRRVEHGRPIAGQAERGAGPRRGRASRRPGSRPSACQSGGSPGCRRRARPTAMQLFSRRRLTKNSRCQASSGSVGASKPYLPPTPWNIWMRQVSWSSRVQVKSDVR